MKRRSASAIARSIKDVARRFLCSLCLVCSCFSPLGSAQDKSPQDEKQPEAAQAQTDAAEKPSEDAQPKKDEDGRLISVPGGKALGMSILGNQEAPKALVIVPWKRSELGNVQGISTMLDDSKQPIDKEVFMRMLSFYEIRSEAAQPNTAAQRRGVGGPARSEEAAKAAYRTDLDARSASSIGRSRKEMPDANKRRKQ